MGLFLGFLSCSTGLYFCFCQYHTVLMTVSLWYNLKSGRLIPPVPFFFLKAALAIQGLLCFHMNCEIFCSSSVKNAISNLIGIALNLSIAFGSIVIFTRLILPTQEHGISLHLFMLSLIFSLVSYNFLCTILVFLGKVIPWYLILFVAYVNGIDSLISLSGFSLLVYRNTSDFVSCNFAKFTDKL